MQVQLPLSTMMSESDTKPMEQAYIISDSGVPYVMLGQIS